MDGVPAPQRNRKTDPTEGFTGRYTTRHGTGYGIRRVARYPERPVRRGSQALASDTAPSFRTLACRALRARLRVGPKTIETWADRVLDAESLEDVFLE